MNYSILDNDLYKFTMQNAVIALFPRAKVKFEFINRGKTVFPRGFAQKLIDRINELSKISLTDDEKVFLEKTCYYLPPTYFDFLKGFKFNPDEVNIQQIDGDVSVVIEGYWYRTILWEVPLMALISELYFEMTSPEVYSEAEIIENTKVKAEKFVETGILFADFGTRRRFSQYNHDLVVGTLKEYAPENLVGTSNVYFAKKYNLTPIGTHAHEWFMFHAAKYGFKMANKLAMENWVKIYRGDLGIALSDTFTTDAFFMSFDTKLAKLFDGVRQDSGDPFEFGEKTIHHYKSLRIDPKSKSIIFSDGLNIQKALEINTVFKNQIKTSFGIGTNLTNDVGAKPLNIVIKLTQAQPEGRDWISTIKLSDSTGKYTGDIETIAIAKKTLGIE
ncbi:MAG: nicotinate phosphoribosyltransferase [Bacteroidales bacterium]|nr:nicotinate phosphoribosyltransferase [Bacteroidales bacterium]